MFKNRLPKQHTHRDSGFTLVELVVSMALTAVFATAIVAVLPAATRIFMQMEDMSRAQIVADMVVDALREECANAYIDDFASVRIVESNPSVDGDEIFIDPLRNTVNNSRITNASQIEITPTPSGKGNVLIIRKSEGYCQAIYSDISISGANCKSVYDADSTPDDNKYDSGYRNSTSTRAVYRFFPEGYDKVGSTETLQGYVHYGYYVCAKKTLACTPGDSSTNVECAFPDKKYDYTNPFSAGTYNGYTVSLEFSDLQMSTEDLYTQRPLCVTVTVKVYKCSYANQQSNDAIYTRSALLVFAEDTTK